MSAHPTRWLFCTLVALTFSQAGFAQPQKEFPKLDEKAIEKMYKDDLVLQKEVLQYLRIAEDTSDQDRYVKLYRKFEGKRSPFSRSGYPEGTRASDKARYAIGCLIIHGDKDAERVLPLIVQTVQTHGPCYRLWGGLSPTNPKQTLSSYDILCSGGKKAVPFILEALENQPDILFEGMIICATAILLDEEVIAPKMPYMVGTPTPEWHPLGEMESWKWDEKYQALLKQAKTDEDKYHAALLCGEPLETAQKDLQKLIESPTTATELRIKALRLYTNRTKTEVAEKYLASLMGDKQDAKINLACKGLLARLKAGEELGKARQNALKKEK